MNQKLSGAGRDGGPRIFGRCVMDLEVGGDITKYRMFCLSMNDYTLK